MKNDLYKIITFGWFVLLSPSAFCLCNTSIPPVTGETQLRSFCCKDLGSAAGLEICCLAWTSNRPKTDPPTPA